MNSLSAVNKTYTIREVTLTVNAAGNLVMAGRVLGRNADKEINMVNIIVVNVDVVNGVVSSAGSNYKIVV